MKPVNLLPAKSEVVKVSSGPANRGLIGGVVAGSVAVVAVAGYFAMARVDSVKSETGQLTTTASSATTETASVRSQIQSLGQPVVDSDVELAQGAEKVLVAAYTERRDYPLMLREVLGVMEGTGGWYTSIEASSTPAENGKTVTLKGYMPTRDKVAALNENLEATKSIKEAVTDKLTTKRKYALDGKRKLGTYILFELTAQLVDQVPPYVADESAALPTSGTDGTTVNDGGDSLALSLDSFDAASATKQGPKVAAKPTEPSKPKNPFDLAATVAAGGSTK
jgi:Tfp pilus assembly protein PilN